MQFNNSQNSDVIYYSIYHCEYDNNFNEDNTLCQIRKSFFETQLKQKNKITKQIDNSCYRYSYVIEQNQPMRWKKMIGDFISEKSVSLPEGGYKIITSQSDKSISKISYFNANHYWIKTEYFSAANSKKPFFIAYPSSKTSSICVDIFDNQESVYNEICLCELSSDADEQENKLIDGCIPAPILTCVTNKGTFYYGTTEQKYAREAILKKIRDNINMTDKDKEPNMDKPEKIIEENTPVEPLCENKDTAKTEMNSLDNDMQGGNESENNTANKHDNVKQQIPYECEAIMSRPKTAYTYTNVYQDIIDSISKAVSPIDSKSIPYVIDTETCFDNDESCPYKRQGKKVIALTENDNYYYFGQMENNLRHGYGRTVMSNGTTAYEGQYINDKRDGFGTYYYPNGKTCYVGGWKANKRHGSGITFMPNSNDIKIGKWDHDTPCGMTFQFDHNGNLIMGGNIENHKINGLGIGKNKESSNLFVSRWENDLPVGRITEFNSNGEMIYNGEYKDFVRCGEGVEYNEKDEVIYQGQWSDNKYNGTGTLYFDDHTYTGNFRNGFPCGHGTIYHNDGTYIEGNFVRWADATTKIVGYNNNVKYIISQLSIKKQ